MARHDFSEAVKRTLAQRVGYLCSNPECRASTSGPHVDPGKRVNLGVAAHITAAARGGPRFDPRLTPEERSSAENGIWLCQNHGKLVDSDEGRYSTALLRAWKTKAELEADSRIGKMRAAGVTEEGLEQAFMPWMVKHRKLIVGAPLAAEQDAHVSEEDSSEPYRHAVRLVSHSPWWRLVMINTGVFAAVGFVLVFGMVKSYLPGMSVALHNATGMTPETASWSIILLIVSMCVVAYVGWTRAAVHVWVEYNRSETVGRDHINALLGRTEEFRRDESPTLVMIVSGGGFSDAAIDLARNKDIECYRRDGEGFARVDK